MKLAPGLVLQMMHLKSRISKGNFKSFIEVGAGDGYVSNLLLKRGLKGIGVDLYKELCDVNSTITNKDYCSSKKYEVINDSFFDINFDEKVDIVISRMVVEHLSDEQIEFYFQKAKSILSPKGRVIIIVPGSQKHWGIEDEMAGHYKRYHAHDAKEFAEKFGLEIENVSGLTYPLGNILLPFSNMLVRKREKGKENMNLQERTLVSGKRNIKFKNSFPKFFVLFINPVTLFPFYLLQKVFKNKESSLTVYYEFSVRK